MLTNFHSHSHFCDGKATIEEFVNAAIERGFKRWGVSPHCPLPMLPRAGWVMKEGDVSAYFAEMERLKAKYAFEIELFAGMEVDYIDGSFNPASDYFAQMPLDYIIGSVHLLRSPQTSELLDVDCGIKQFAATLKNHYGGSLRRLVEAYYAAKAAMVECGGFSFLGHADKVSSNARELSSGVMDTSWYRGLVDDFLRLCASRSVVLEINTKAYYSHGIFFPDARNFERMAELGISVIINSDTHRPERARVGLAEAAELYKGEILYHI